MIAIPIVFFFWVFTLLLIAYPPTRALFIRPKTPARLLAAESAELCEWKKVFRDTVVSSEGALTPEMEAFLVSHDELVNQFLASARKEAEKDRAEIIEKAKKEHDEILKKAEEERAEILKENEEWSKSRRPLLAGKALAEFNDDYAACTEPQERFNTIKRWHNKGFRFSKEMRKARLTSASNASTRDDFRKMFDEQDADVEVSRIVLINGVEYK